MPTANAIIKDRKQLIMNRKKRRTSGTIQGPTNKKNYDCWRRNEIIKWITMDGSVQSGDFFSKSKAYALKSETTRNLTEIEAS